MRTKIFELSTNAYLQLSAVLDQSDSRASCHATAMCPLMLQFWSEGTQSCDAADRQQSDVALLYHHSSQVGAPRWQEVVEVVEVVAPPAVAFSQRMQLPLPKTAMTIFLGPKQCKISALKTFLCPDSQLRCRRTTSKPCISKRSRLRRLSN